MTNDEMTAEIRDAAKVMAEGVAYIDRLKAEIADLKHELTSAIERAQSERHTAELAEKEAAQDRFRREHLEKALALQAEDIIQEIEKSHQLAREIESLRALADTDSADLLTMLAERTLEVDMLKAKLAARLPVRLPMRHNVIVGTKGEVPFMAPDAAGVWMAADDVLAMLTRAGVEVEHD